MGFLSRLFVPRGARKTMHPARAFKRVMTPKAVKRARRAAHPISNASYSITQAINTTPRVRRPVHLHGSCQVKHRSAGAASRCRNR
jgi:hypothetical protein